MKRSRSEPGWIFETRNPFHPEVEIGNNRLSGESDEILVSGRSGGATYVRLSVPYRKSQLPVLVPVSISEFYMYRESNFSSHAPVYSMSYVDPEGWEI